jgi:hypothetical protein
MTHSTGCRASDVHRLLTTGEDPLEGHCDGDLQIGALLRTTWTAAAKETLKETPPPEARVQTTEEVADIDTAEEILGGKTTHTRHATGVVCRALLRVREDCIGFGNLLKLLLSVRRFVAVGMILQGQLTKGVLECLLVRIARDTQNLVVIT